MPDLDAQEAARAASHWVPVVDVRGAHVPVPDEWVEGAAAAGAAQFSRLAAIRVLARAVEAELHAEVAALRSRGEHGRVILEAMGLNGKGNFARKFPELRQPPPYGPPRRLGTTPGSAGEPTT